MNSELVKNLIFLVIVSSDGLRSRWAIATANDGVEEILATSNRVFSDENAAWAEVRWIANMMNLSISRAGDEEEIENGT